MRIFSSKHFMALFTWLAIGVPGTLSGLASVTKKISKSWVMLSRVIFRRHVQVPVNWSNNHGPGRQF